MFNKHSEEGFKPLIDGISLKVLSHGEKTLLGKFRLEGVCELPMHTHPYEQTGIMLSGHMVLTIGDERHDVREGDSWCIPIDVPHGADVLEDSVVVEVFSPPREDYLKK